MRLILSLLLCGVAGAGLAQDRIPSHCIALSQAIPDTTVHYASFRDAVADDTVRLSYVHHAMFLLQTQGVAAMTDFTGYFGNVDFLPDVVTMNHAHSTHWTAAPDPAIPHVLQGWGDGTGPADHYLDLGEMLVRNVPTDIRRGAGVEEGGNSIFVFEAAGLCIGHLGHLHHEPTPQQYAALGRLDVVMAAVDGGLTVDLPTMIGVLQRLRATVVVPMHWFGRTTLEAFLTGMQDEFAIQRVEGNEIVLSLRTLPDRPTVLVLEPAMLTEPAD
jgi:hypothetical protein